VSKVVLKKSSHAVMIPDLMIISSSQSGRSEV